MSFFKNMTLYERVTECTLAMRYTYGEKSHTSSYDEVMKYSSYGDINDKIKNIIREGFETPAKREQVLTYITIELSKDTKKVIVLEIYKRLKHIDDFQMDFIKNIFRFSTINSTVLSILDNALASDKSVHFKIRKELRNEFFNIFIDVMENNIKNGVSLNGIGYKSLITKDQLGNFKEIVKKCMPTMLRRWGSCFMVDFFTTEDFSNSFSGFSFNRKIIDVSLMTPGDLKKSLNKRDVNMNFFIEALFSIMSYTYDPIIKIYQNIVSEDVKDFFMKSVIGKTQSKHLKLLNETLLTKEVLKSSSKIEKTDEKVEHVSEEVEELKKRIDTLEETIRDDREKYKSDIKKLIFEKAELSASRRDLLEQLDRKRKFCAENHEYKNTRNDVKITKFDLLDL